MRIVSTLAAAAALALAAVPVQAAPACVNSGSFEHWLEGFKKDAAAAGVKPSTISQALGNMTADMSIISSDRKQGFFSQTFLDFQAKLATANRVQNGMAKIKQQHAVFDRVEKEYGVPAPVITGFWALESDFGSGMGKKPVLRSLATLAYDCRRGEMFRQELIYALKIIDRGDLTADEMIGSWAGELGQTQFLPGHYYNFAVDYDGDGKRDLMRSNPDIIASSANFIRSLGWVAGQPWLQEVRVPANLPWEKTGLDVKIPRSQWAAWGVTAVDGSKLPSDELPSSLLLLMGRNGPAFLAYPNFDVYIKWNQSLNYATTAAYLATRIAGAPAMHRGSAQIVSLDGQQIVEMQHILAKRGYNVGEPDGRLGAASRVAVRDAQKKMGMPADGYPTQDFLAALRAGR